MVLLVREGVGPGRRYPIKPEFNKINHINHYIESLCLEELYN